jgi:hypothetical protein
LATWPQALDALRAEGCPIADDDLVHLAPTLRAQINPYRKYSFDVEAGRHRTALRPLRQPEAATA